MTIIWWRAYNSSIDHPKLLKLSDAMHRAWYTLQCVASENGGTLPATEDIAVRLRMKPAKVAEWITKLVQAKLIDNDGGVFSPHNWDDRQYKSDGSTERVKRFRERQRNASCNISETANETKTETGPEQSRTETDTEQSRAEAPRAVVSGSEKALRSDLMEVFPNAPNYDRTAVWLGKGYAPSMIIDVVKELLARKPDIANLAYFDAALAERHSKRAETPSERAAAAPSVSLDKVVAMYAATGVWSRYAGPEPGLSGCKVSAELLAKHGLGADGQKIRVAV